MNTKLSLFDNSILFIDPRRVEYPQNSILDSKSLSPKDYKENIASLKVFYQDKDRLLWWNSPLNISFLQNGFVVVPIYGDLVAQPANYIYEAVTSYKEIKDTISNIVADGRKNIILDISSYGGQSSGLFGLCDYISSLKDSGITVVGYTETFACSAAQLLLSACQYSYATEEATLGSIGAVSVHKSFEKQLTNIGVEVTLFSTGKYKTLGNSYKDLSQEDRDAIQQETDLLLDKFLSKLKDYKNTDSSNLKNLEAKLLGSNEALELKLITGIRDVMTNSDKTLDNLAKPAGSLEQPTPQPVLQTPNIEEVLAAERTRISDISEALAAYGLSANDKLRELLVKSGFSKETMLETVKVFAANTTTVLSGQPRVEVEDKKLSLAERLQKIGARHG